MGNLGIALTQPLDTGDDTTCTGVMGAARADSRDELPLACTLGPDDGPARLNRWQRLHESAAPAARLIDGVLQVRYRPSTGVLEELEALAASEQVCCPFVTWSVTEEGGVPVLHVTSPPGRPEAVVPIAAMFGVERPVGR